MLRVMNWQENLLWSMVSSLNLNYYKEKLLFPKRFFFFFLMQSGREILCCAQLIWLLSALLALQFINLVVWKEDTLPVRQCLQLPLRGRNSNSYYLLPKHICQREIWLYPGRRAGRALGVGAAPGACWGCKPRQWVSILPCAGTAVLRRAPVVWANNLKFAASKWQCPLVLLCCAGSAGGCRALLERAGGSVLSPMGHHWIWGGNKHAPCLSLPRLLSGTQHTALNGPFSMCDISLAISLRFIGLA